MGSGYLRIKSFHIVFVASWFYSRSMPPTARLGYHLACRGSARDLDVGAKRRSACWLTISHGSSVLLIAAIVLLVVVKPL